MRSRRTLHRRAHLSVNISVPVIEQARATVAALKGTDPHAESLSALVEHGLRVQIARLEKKYNMSQPYPPAPALPPRGRGKLAQNTDPPKSDQEQ